MFDSAPPTARDGFSFAAFLNALWVRRWLIAAVSVPLGVVTAAIVWLAFPAEYTAKAMLLCKLGKPAGLELTPTRESNKEEIAQAQRSMLALIRSQKVLGDALSSKNDKGSTLVELPLFGSSPESVSWLAANLRASFNDDTEYLSLSLSGLHPEDQAAILNAIGEEFNKALKNEAKTQRDTLRERLDSAIDKTFRDIEKKRIKLAGLEQKVRPRGVVDPDQQLRVATLATMTTDHIRLKADLQHATESRDQLKKDIEKAKKEPLPAIAIEAVLGSIGEVVSQLQNEFVFTSALEAALARSPAILRQTKILTDAEEELRDRFSKVVPENDLKGLPGLREKVNAAKIDLQKIQKSETEAITKIMREQAISAMMGEFAQAERNVVLLTNRLAATAAELKEIRATLGSSAFAPHQNAEATSPQKHIAKLAEMRDLQLMPAVKDESAIPTKGKNLIIVASVASFKLTEKALEKALEMGAVPDEVKMKLIALINKRKTLINKELSWGDLAEEITTVLNAEEIATVLNAEDAKKLQDLISDHAVSVESGVLHFRIFDGNGNHATYLSDKIDSTQKTKIEDLKTQLKELWLPHTPTEAENSKVITAVASILGPTLAVEAQEAKSTEINKAEKAAEAEAKLTAQVEQIRKEVEQLEDMNKTLKDKSDKLAFEFADTSKDKDTRPGSNPLPIVDTVSFVSKASPPRVPDVRGRIIRTAGAGVGVAALAMLSLGFWEMSRRRLRTREEVTARVGLRVLGTLPQVRSETSRNPVAGAVLGSPDRALFGDHADSIRTLLLSGGSLISPEGVPIRSLCRVIVVTSASPAEGKSILSLNLVASLVRAGKRALLIDADLRRPSLHNSLGNADHPGLSEVLTDAIPIRDAIQFPTPGLGFIGAGLMCDEGLEALGRVDHTAFLEELLKEWDVIVLDTPPILSGPDGLILGGVADGVLLAVRSGVSHTEEVCEASRLLEEAGCRVLGAVLNGVSTNRTVYNYRARRSQSSPLAKPPVAIEGGPRPRKVRGKAARDGGTP